MKISLLLLVSLGYMSGCFSQNNLPYPIIFVHGLTGSDQTFGPTMEYLSVHDSLGGINVFDVVLNADNDNTTSLLSNDVKWQDFSFNGDPINVGRRNYQTDINDFVDGWTGSYLFAINFKEERIRGASGSFNDLFDQSNESGVYKQGHALGKMIGEVLTYTGAEKVILVGHSMGGLAIREYLQRMDANSQHPHYIDPNDFHGHHVARVATYGTPHTGSNTATDPTKASDIPNPLGYSEANRDLLWQYNSFTQCSDYPVGIYLFGGNEACIQSVSGNATFPNVDINCNGIENDDIIGINENFYSYDFNYNMSLPDKIDYTYMCSVWANWGSGLIGDGAVSIHRQWLHDLDIPSPQGLADTTMSSIPHTSEGGDYKTILRGIDEPEQSSRAFKVDFNKKYIGYLTYQQNMQPYDGDFFKIDCSNVDSLQFTLDSESLNMISMSFIDENSNTIYFSQINSTHEIVSIAVPSEIVFLRIQGKATYNSWENPYHFLIEPLNYVGVDEVLRNDDFKMYPNPTNDFLHIETEIIDYNVKLISMDGREVLFEKNQSKLDVQALKKGIYLLQLISENGISTKRFVKN